VKKVANPVKKRCFLCYFPAEEGVRFLKAILCPECEKKIVDSLAAEESYNGYVERIKQVWHDFV